MYAKAASIPFSLTRGNGNIVAALSCHVPSARTCAVVRDSRHAPIQSPRLDRDRFDVFHWLSLSFRMA
jgi:hypothetical protein